VSHGDLFADARDAVRRSNVRDVLWVLCGRMHECN
jgi:hypothetical protein